MKYASTLAGYSVDSLEEKYETIKKEYEKAKKKSDDFKIAQSKKKFIRFHYYLDRNIKSKTGVKEDFLQNVAKFRDETFEQKTFLHNLCTSLGWSPNWPRILYSAGDMFEYFWRSEGLKKDEIDVPTAVKDAYLTKLGHADVSKDMTPLQMLQELYQTEKGWRSKLYKLRSQEQGKIKEIYSRVGTQNEAPKNSDRTKKRKYKNVVNISAFHLDHRIR